MAFTNTTKESVKINGTLNIELDGQQLSVPISAFVSPKQLTGNTTHQKQLTALFELLATDTSLQATATITGDITPTLAASKVDTGIDDFLAKYAQQNADQDATQTGFEDDTQPQSPKFDI